ncbi:MAG: mannose-1-phosphate guanylyltransferase, partial [Planctomycetes bacterium]|nr:mannose-1-phosphate guanylyltransferase [Planctomycetota bacterium]
MAGGSGTRFWPFSTPEKPKQFLDLTGSGTMLQLTVKRLEGLVAQENIWVITGEKYCSLVAEQCPELEKSQIIGEPMPRDTSGAVALAAGLVAAKDPEAIMAVLPADHIIEEIQKFQDCLQKAITLAKADHFVTLGIKPTYPAEGYGYLHRGESLGEGYELKEFVEKPNREAAEKYLASGEYYWNAGMFVWKVSLIMSALKTHLPVHFDMAEKLGAKIPQEGWSEDSRETFAALEKVSIDFGLMEKLSHIAMTEAHFDWNDVGGWLALEDLIDQDDENNTLQGKNITRDINNNIIITQEEQRPTLVVGIKDCVIVNAKAGTLVCHRSEIERIKDLIQKITAP